jgi:hypothetical protein
LQVRDLGLQTLLLHSSPFARPSFFVRRAEQQHHTMVLTTPFVLLFLLLLLSSFFVFFFFFFFFFFFDDRIFTLCIFFGPLLRAYSLAFPDDAA